MNISKVGRIYHVVDKTTEEIVKVGSTTRTLEQRFNQSDYKKKYVNHFLREARVIQSSEFDWYDPEDHQCPFIWHLMAAEHLEMLKMDTYRKSSFSNRTSPLDQKSIGLDSSLSRLGGYISGMKSAQNGGLEIARQHITKERKIEGGKKAGKLAVASGRMSSMGKKGGSISGPANGRKIAESGILKRVSTFETQSAGGLIGGRKNSESGHMSKLGDTYGSVYGKIYGPRIAHVRWHIKRGIVKPNCKLCQEDIVNGSV